MKKFFKIIGRIIVISAFYAIYKLTDFETTVIIVLAGIFVNTNPERKTKVTVSGKDVAKKQAVF